MIFTMGWVMTMEEVVVMGPLGRVVVLVGHLVIKSFSILIHNTEQKVSPVLVAVVEPCVQQDEGEVDGVCGDADGGGELLELVGVVLVLGELLMTFEDAMNG